MKSKFKIPDPCSERWSEMEDFGVDKFCGKCNKKVFDFSKKSEIQIAELLKENKNICVKINKKSSLMASLAVFITLNITSCTTQLPLSKQIENAENQFSIISGKINAGYSKKGVENAEINIVTKEKIYRTYSDSLGNFSFRLPTNIIAKNLLFSLEYGEIKKDKSFSQHQQRENFVFSKEQILKPIDISYHNYAIIGGLLISDEIPINRYFIDGEKVSEKDFNNIIDPKNGFWIHLEDKDEKKTVVGRTGYDNVFLFYTTKAILNQ